MVSKNSKKASKRGNKNTENVSNKKAHTEVDDCVSEDNDTDSEEELGTFFKKSLVVTCMV